MSPEVLFGWLISSSKYQTKRVYRLKGLLWYKIVRLRGIFWRRCFRKTAESFFWYRFSSFLSTKTPFCFNFVFILHKCLWVITICDVKCLIKYILFILNLFVIVVQNCKTVFRDKKRVSFSADPSLRFLGLCFFYYKKFVD